MGVKDRSSPCKTVLSSTKLQRSDGYYLECRKDAQCECSMCKASITATLDLRQPLKSSTKENQPWPPPFPCSSPVPSSVPKKRSLNPHNPFPSRSFHHRKLRFGNRVFSLPLLFLLTPLVLLLAMPWFVSFISQAYFSYESFTELAQASLVRIRLLDRLDFIQRRVSRISKTPSVSNCTGYGDASWRLAENGHLLHSKCIIYASPLERVSVWGSSAMTGGILGRSLVDRSFTVLAGRVMEWEEGRIQSIVHPEGSSWTMNRWTASAVVLDSNTWILEYKRTPLSVELGGIHSLKHMVVSAFAKGVNNVKLYFDTVLFVQMKGHDVFAYQAVSRQPPT